MSLTENMMAPDRNERYSNSEKENHLSEFGNADVLSFMCPVKREYSQQGEQCTHKHFEALVDEFFSDDSFFSIPVEESSDWCSPTRRIQTAKKTPCEGNAHLQQKSSASCSTTRGKAEKPITTSSSSSRVFTTSPRNGIIHGHKKRHVPVKTIAHLDTEIPLSAPTNPSSFSSSWKGMRGIPSGQCLGALTHSTLHFNGLQEESHVAYGNVALPDYPPPPSSSSTSSAAARGAGGDHGPDSPPRSEFPTSRKAEGGGGDVSSASVSTTTTTMIHTMNSTRDSFHCNSTHHATQESSNTSNEDSSNCSQSPPGGVALLSGELASAIVHRNHAAVLHRPNFPRVFQSVHDENGNKGEDGVKENVCTSSLQEMDSRRNKGSYTYLCDAGAESVSTTTALRSFAPPNMTNRGILNNSVCCVGDILAEENCCMPLTDRGSTNTAHTQTNLDVMASLCELFTYLHIFFSPHSSTS